MRCEARRCETVEGKYGERLHLLAVRRLTQRFVERRCDARGSRGISRLDADRHFPQKEGGRSALGFCWRVRERVRLPERSCSRLMVSAVI
jgi:hypothetical protein